MPTHALGRSPRSDELSASLRASAPPLRKLADSGCKQPRKIAIVSWGKPQLNCKFHRLQELYRLALRRHDQLALPHHAAAADESPNRPPGHRHAVIGRPSGARGNPAVGDGFAALEI